MANILVYIETMDERADPACLDVLSSMRRVASSLGATLYAVMPTVEPPVYGEDDIVATISRHGADKVILLSHPSLSAPASFDSHGAAVLAATNRLPPSLLVFADTPGCRDVALGCGAALSAPMLVHPVLDLEQHPWPARVFSRFHDTSKVYHLGEMDRPLVILAAPGHSRPAANESSDDAEVVVLSPKTTLRRLVARPKSAPILPQPRSDLLLAWSNQAPAPKTRDRLLLLAKRLGADVAGTPPDDELDELRSDSRENAVGSEPASPWARTVILFDASPSARRLSNLSRAAHLLWVSHRHEGFPFHAEARISEDPTNLLEELVTLAPALDQKGQAEESPTLHFRASSTETGQTPLATQDPTLPGSIDTLVLLAGPEPGPDGPAIDVLLDFLEPAKNAALNLPAKKRVILCCGTQAADPLMAALGQWPFDRLIRIVSPISGPLATAGLARLLAAGVQKLQADLVVAGDQGGRWHRGITGPAVAQALDWPFITGAQGPFSVTQAGLLARKRAWQTTWTWQIQTPALLCVAQEPPGTTNKDIAHQTTSPKISLWTIADLGLQKQDVLPLCKQSEDCHREARDSKTLDSAADVLDWLSARRRLD